MIPPSCAAGVDARDGASGAPPPHGRERGTDERGRVTGGSRTHRGDPRRASAVERKRAPAHASEPGRWVRWSVRGVAPTLPIVRIALVSTPFVSLPPPGYGGTELVVDALARALVRAGHEVSVFATGDSRAPGLRAAFEAP